LLLEKVAKRVKDGDVMRLLKMILKATGKKGVPQGGVISPLLSNLYQVPQSVLLGRFVKLTPNMLFALRNQYAAIS
jgi:RNA-directed DNA polymerase